MTDSTKLERTREQWTKCDPDAMSRMSQAAVFYALNDAKRDVLAMHDLIEQQAARIAAFESAAKATVGFKVVPVEPTEEMIRAACLAQSNVQAGSYAEWHDNHSSGISERIRELVVRDYLAMLAAAPAAIDNGGRRDAWLAEVCEDADGTKHIAAVVEELDDIPTGTRLYPSTHMAWRPIKTAPKDGTWILMTNGVDVAGGQWIRDEGGTTEYRDEDGRYMGQTDRDDFEGWMDWMGGIPNPTHWSPLPAAPAALSQKAGE